MHFRAHIPILLISHDELIGKSIRAPFKRAGIHAEIEASFEATQIEGEEVPEMARARCKSLCVTIVEPSTSARSKRIVQPDGDLTELAVTVCYAANRFIRAARRAARAESLTELTLDAERSDEYLKYWKVEYSTDGEAWRACRDGTAPAFFAWNPGLSTGLASITAVEARSIAEYVEDDLGPAPEIDVALNAARHLDQRNFRLAVLEAVIGLEIALSSYLQVQLSSREDMNRQHVTAFLSPSLGLRDRLAVVYPLIVGRRGLSLEERTKIIEVIKWRNDIVHKSGRLPEVDNNVLKAKTQLVIDATYGLSQERRDEEGRQRFAHVSRALKNGPLKERPMIETSSDHEVSIEWTLFPFVQVAKQDIIDAAKQAADAVAPVAASSDRRFDRDQHLVVLVSVGASEILRFQNGKLSFDDETYEAYLGDKWFETFKTGLRSREKAD